MGYGLALLKIEGMSLLLLVLYFYSYLLCLYYCRLTGTTNFIRIFLSTFALPHFDVIKMEEPFNVKVKVVRTELGKMVSKN